MSVTKTIVALKRNLEQNTHLLASRLKNQSEILRRLESVEKYCNTLRDSHEYQSKALAEMTAKYEHAKLPWYKKLAKKLI